MIFTKSFIAFIFTRNMNGMKQAILFLLVTFSFLTIASAQPCIPQWTGATPSGIEPDTVTNLLCPMGATVGVIDVTSGVPLGSS